MIYEKLLWIQYNYVQVLIAYFFYMKCFSKTTTSLNSNSTISTAILDGIVFDTPEYALRSVAINTNSLIITLSIFISFVIVLSIFI